MISAEYTSGILRRGWGVNLSLYVLSDQPFPHPICFPFQTFLHMHTFKYDFGYDWIRLDTFCIRSDMIFGSSWKTSGPDPIVELGRFRYLFILKLNFQGTIDRVNPIDDRVDPIRFFAYVPT